MGKIFLVRHGQSVANERKIFGGRMDCELTELGRAQAREIVPNILTLGINVIYSSPLKRAYETACIIAKELKIGEIITDDRLMERDFGVLTGKLIADVEKYADKIIRLNDKEGYFLEAKEAESFPALLLRGREVLETIKEKHSDENLLIVTHGDIGKMIYAAYYNLGWEEALRTPHYKNTEIVELS